MFGNTNTPGSFWNNPNQQNNNLAGSFSNLSNTDQNSNFSFGSFGMNSTSSTQNPSLSGNTFMNTGRTDLFGSSQQSLFGQTNTLGSTSLFGNTGQTNSLFGSNMNNNTQLGATGNPLFGSTSTSTTQPSTGLFGSTSTNTGFNQITGNEVATASNFDGSTIVNVAYGTNNSQDEYRWAYYKQNDPSMGGTPGMSLGTTTGALGSGLFGSTTPSTPGTGLFGSTTNTGLGSTTGTGLFGSTTSTTSTPLFGGTTASTSQPSTGLFGSTSTNTGFGTSTGTGLFGSTTSGTTGTGLFGSTASNTGFGTSTGSGLFGSTTTSGTTGTGLFGSTTNTGLGSTSLGATTTQPSSGLFGSTSTTGTTGTGLFGSTTTPSTTGTGLFGTSTNTGYGSTSTGTGLFGSTTGTSTLGSSTLGTNQGTGLFGSTASNTGFGTSTLGTAGTTGTGLFGSTSTSTTQPSTGLFGTTATGTTGLGSTNLGTTSTGLFGSTTTPLGATSTTGFGTSTGLTGASTFGTTTTQPSTGLFGSSTLSSTGLGASTLGATGTGTGLFGSTTNTGLGSTTGTGLFGSNLGTTTGALGSGLYGSTYGTNQGTGLFGTGLGQTGYQTPGTGLYGSSALGSGLYGTGTTYGGLGGQYAPSTGLFGGPMANVNGYTHTPNIFSLGGIPLWDLNVPSPGLRSFWSSAANLPPGSAEFLNRVNALSNEQQSYNQVYPVNNSYSNNTDRFGLRKCLTDLGVALPRYFLNTQEHNLYRSYPNLHGLMSNNYDQSPTEYISRARANAYLAREQSQRPCFERLRSLQSESYNDNHMLEYYTRGGQLKQIRDLTRSNNNEPRQTVFSNRMDHSTNSVNSDSDSLIGPFLRNRTKTRLDPLYRTPVEDSDVEYRTCEDQDDEENLLKNESKDNYKGNKSKNLNGIKENGELVNNLNGEDHTSVSHDSTGTRVRFSDLPMSRSGSRTRERENHDQDLSDDVPSQNPPILTKQGYSTRPTMDSLVNMSDRELSSVVDFQIIRDGYGDVLWMGRTDLRGVNLDQLVDIGYRKVTVNWGDEEVPPKGTGLNKTALITLYNCTPKDFDPKLITLQTKKLDKLKEYTESCGCKFVSFNFKTGVWMFETPYFVDTDKNNENYDRFMSFNPRV